MAQEREIQYSNKTFSDFRQQLIDYAKNYFPDTYNDFSPTSPGMMFVEMASYVGDVLSFYQDIQLQETFLQYAQEPGNLYSLAYMMGYTPKTTSAAIVTLDVYQQVPSKNAGSNAVPDYDYAITLDNNAVIQSATNPPVQFLIQDKVNFGFSSSYDPTTVSIYETTAGNITFGSSFGVFDRSNIQQVIGQLNTSAYRGLFPGGADDLYWTHEAYAKDGGSLVDRTTTTTPLNYANIGLFQATGVGTPNGESIRENVVWLGYGTPSYAYLTGSISEIVIFNSDIRSKRTYIENDQMEYHNI